MRLRGAQIQVLAHYSHPADLIATGASLVRVQLDFRDLANNLNNFDTFPKVAGVKYILDAHYWDTLETFPEQWAHIAERYEHRDDLVYGICNECPLSMSETVKLMKKCIKTIRNIDTKPNIAVTTPYAHPAKFAKLPFLFEKRIWYEAHMYMPLKFTHQGIYQNPIGRKPPSKEKILNWLEPVRAFQKEHKAPILLGEFGCSIYTKEEDRLWYLETLIKIFKQYRWRWCYHAWREAPVWDAENYPVILNALVKGWS